MHTPKQVPENSPEDENSDELQAIFNPITASPPSFDEEEWLYLNSIVEIFPQYNPVTASFAESNDE